MINMELDYIDMLNRQYQGGKWLKAALLIESRSPLVEKYFVEHEDPITFQGRTSIPLHMFWEGLKTSVGMPTEGSNIALSNLGNQVVKYLGKNMDPSGLEVTLQLLHLDLLNTLTRPYERYFKIIAARADQNMAVFVLGRQFGRNRLPRRMIFADEMT
jgi:hypothetical protein